MKINLNCLKFHYFKFDSNLHNLWCKKNCDSFFNDIILENKRSLKSAINKIKNLNDITKNDFSHFHQIDEYHSEKVIKIIKKCHKNLNSYLEQYLEESDDFNKLLFYQIELVKPIRLIFIKNNDEFIPLIFDLHHLIYESNKKNHDSNITSKKYQWDYKYKQNEFKNKILEINDQN